MKISIIIPVYNEMGRLQHVLKRLKKYDEVIVVDDASKIPVLNYLKKDERYKNTVFLRNYINSGYLFSIKRGIKYACGDIIITMDADGEHRPKDIDKLVLPILKGECDIVYGKRPNIARVSELMLLRMANYLTGEYIKDAGTGFRAIKALYAKELKLKGKCTCGMLHLEAYQKGMRSCEVSVDLPFINKPRRVAWEHFPQFFILLKSYLSYKWFEKCI